LVNTIRRFENLAAELLDQPYPNDVRISNLQEIVHKNLLIYYNENTIREVTIEDCKVFLKSINFYEEL
jgi:hypothetical protein